MRMKLNDGTAKLLWD